MKFLDLIGTENKASVDRSSSERNSLLDMAIMCLVSCVLGSTSVYLIMGAILGDYLISLVFPAILLLGVFGAIVTLGRKRPFRLYIGLCELVAVVKKLRKRSA